PLPPAPPRPMTPAALAAGVLPCLERLLRRAPEAGGVDLRRCLLPKKVFDLESLAPLLAYGEPRQAAALVATEQRAQETDGVGCEIALLLGESCCCVAAAFPDEVRSAALSAAAAAEEGVASGGSGASRGGGLGGRSSGRRAGGLSGARAGGSSSSTSNSSQSQPADWAGAAAASGPGGWRPSLLRALAAELRAHGRDAAHGTVAAAVADLAGKLEACLARGSGGGGGEAGAGWLGTPALVIAWSEGASGLRVPPPAEGRALLRTCANPACDNLAGGSEAELPLRACGRCGAAWYCRPECQTAHWRAGHREACGRLERPHPGVLATSPASQAWWERLPPWMVTAP
ncbi:hypothetical protein TSOC_008155, partial [Tetrabaena socialis]